MKGEILKLLKETGGYLSGQELCERFGVSRTAVWKVMNQLKDEGYEIEAQQRICPEKHARRAVERRA